MPASVKRFAALKLPSKGTIMNDQQRSPEQHHTKQTQVVFTCWQPSQTLRLNSLSLQGQAAGKDKNPAAWPCTPAERRVK
jgi:hypothetical protein